MFSLIWIIIGVTILGFYNGLMLLDDKTSETDLSNKSIENKWHFVGVALFLYLSITTSIIWGWVYIPFTLSLFWGLFGGIVHKIGLKKSFFFVGNTAKTDILIRKLFKNNPELWSAILKILVMVLSIFLIIIYR